MIKERRLPGVKGYAIVAVLPTFGLSEVQAQFSSRRSRLRRVRATSTIRTPGFPNLRGLLALRCGRVCEAVARLRAVLSSRRAFDDSISASTKKCVRTIRIPFLLFEVFMARITVEDCLEVVDNRFELVLMATKRARQLANGAEATIDAGHDKPTVLALREIAGRKIDQDLIDEVDKAARAKAEREALEWAAAEVDDDFKSGDDL